MQIDPAKIARLKEDLGAFRVWLATNPVKWTVLLYILGVASGAIACRG